jgi:hypothetical protein
MSKRWGYRHLQHGKTRTGKLWHLIVPVPFHRAGDSFCTIYAPNGGIVEVRPDLPWGGSACRSCEPAWRDHIARIFS